jgi:hypothetical protein
MGRFRFTLASVFGALTAIGGLLAFWRSVDHARKSAEVTMLASSFKQAVLSLANAEATYGRLPDATCYTTNRTGPVDPEVAKSSPPLYSWRLAVMPFTEYQVRNADFSKPWDHPANVLFHSERHFYTFFGLPPPEGSEPRIFAITGPATAFGEAGVDTPHSLDDVPDDTILLVEVANSGVHWMQPGDFDIRTMPRTINDPRTVDIEGTPGFGFYVAFADGQVWRLRHDTPFPELEKFFTIEGAKANEREEVLSKYWVDR